MTTKLTNFTKNNTPPFYQKIGNIFLILAAVGGTVALAPISTPSIVTVGAWTAMAGAIGKILTKFKGE
jgi:hypothetical protein